MHEVAYLSYYDAGDFQVLRLPYTGGEASMVVLLPKKRDGLADLEKSLTVDKLADAIGKLQREKVDVTLPRFKATQEFSLNETLEALGMKKAFTPAADFSGLNGGNERLFISWVVHKAFVEVNEKGTEAAAATGVGIVAVSDEGDNPKPVPVFRADHPFLFLIRDDRTGSILFLGRLADPR
jgi:serpin B